VTLYSGQVPRQAERCSVISILLRSAAAGRSPALLQDAAKKLPRMKDSSSQRECLDRDKNAV
jgi:hypothetical protein